MFSEQNRIPLAGAQLWLYPQLFVGQADAWFENLLREAAWQREKLRFFGREVEVPRRVAWYGEPGAEYCYSGRSHSPLPWIPPLGEMRSALQSLFEHSFNSALLNLYRNGDDHMGWHSDDEPELQPKPLIASLSFGVARPFELRSRSDGERISLHLEHGSLLLMGGDTQKNWHHRAPRLKNCSHPRVNVTFRQIRRSA